MLKVFLSASVTSMMCFAQIHATGIGASNLTNCEKDGLKNKYGLPALFAGGACLGAGMFVSGACPGIVMAQMGAGSWRSIATFGGCVFASFAMVALAPSLERAKGALNYTVGKPERIGLHTLLLGNSRKHRLIMSTLVILCMTGVIVLAEILSPGLGQLEIKDAGMKAAWHPIICGAIIGLMQIPLMLTGGKQLGSSYAYIVIVGIITFPFSTCLPKRFKKGIEGGILNMYKLPFLVTAAISALVVGTVFASTSPFLTQCMMSPSLSNSSVDACSSAEQTSAVDARVVMESVALAIYALKVSSSRVRCLREDMRVADLQPTWSVSICYTTKKISFANAPSCLRGIRIISSNDHELVSCPFMYVARSSSQSIHALGRCPLRAVSTCRTRLRRCSLDPLSRVA